MDKLVPAPANIHINSKSKKQRMASLYLDKRWITTTSHIQQLKRAMTMTRINPKNYLIVV
jgi:hypothetical protein